jgi:hypothetical protein
MTSIKVLISLIAFSFILFFVGSAHAGPLATPYGQTFCIDDPGNATTFAFELREENDGAVICAGIAQVLGTESQMAGALTSLISGCAPDVSAYPSETLGFTCAAGWSGFTVARDTNTTPFELALTDTTNGNQFKVGTFADPISFNSMCGSAQGNDKSVPCNGSNPCCDGSQTPPCNRVPEPGAFAGLLSGSYLLYGMSRRRERQ